MTIQRWELEGQEWVMLHSQSGEWVKFAEHQAAIEALSKALADMIAIYETKQRNSVRLGNARAALTSHGIWPSMDAMSEKVR